MFFKRDKSKEEKECNHNWVFEKDDVKEDNCNFLFFKIYKCKKCGKIMEEFISKAP